MRANRELTEKEQEHVLKTMKYNREKTKSYMFRLQKTKDKDIINYLATQRNKTKLFKKLLREQMLKEWVENKKKKGNK